MLLPGANPETACSVAHRVRVSTQALSVPAKDAHGHHQELNDVTVSIGVATSARYGYDLHDLLRAADSALLAAKSVGRNAVTVA